MGGHRVQGTIGIAVDSELSDIHAKHFSPGHGRSDRLGNGAKIFTDDLHLMALRFEVQNRVKLGGTVMHVNSVSGAESMGNPKGAMQTHHMIDTQHSRRAHVMAQAIAIVTKAVCANCFGMQWWKAPILTAGE